MRTKTQEQLISRLCLLLGWLGISTRLSDLTNLGTLRLRMILDYSNCILARRNGCLAEDDLIIAVVRSYLFRSAQKTSPILMVTDSFVISPGSTRTTNTAPYQRLPWQKQLAEAHMKLTAEQCSQHMYTPYETIRANTDTVTICQASSISEISSDPFQLFSK